jgi:electron transfer flavoprotein beta subunit
MRIVILIKQVPATDKVKIDEKTGTMKREEVDAVINPLDLYAIEAGLQVKEKIKEDSEIIVISMGPPKATEVIKEAISMGCDRGYLLSDKAFAGADTWATSYTLSSFIKKLENFSIIFTGEKATDGETGQVGPSISAQLDLPILTYVSKIIDIGKDYIIVEREIEEGTEIVKSTIPCVISVIKAISEPRLPTLRGKLKAREIDIPIITLKDLGLSENDVGLSGSPTRVVKIFYPKISRHGLKIKEKNLEKAVDIIINFLEERGII